MRIQSWAELARGKSESQPGSVSPELCSYMAVLLAGLLGALVRLGSMKLEAHELPKRNAKRINT